MRTLQEIKDKSAKMQSYLEESPGSEPNEIIDRMEKLNVLIALSGVLLSEAKYHQDSVVNKALKATIDRFDSWTASTINKFASTLAMEENFLVNQLDRINSTAGHQLDALRSILSYRKAEMTL